MAIILGLLTAVCFGAGDFFGGLSAKRVSVVVVIALSHLVGLASVTVAALALAEQFLLRDFIIGIIAGAAGGGGVALLYRGLARGPMAVVAPLTAITSAAVPAFWGVVNGETFTVLAWVGILVAGIAILLTSLPADRTAGAPIDVRVVLESLLAGSLFGVLFVLFDSTSSSTAPWPVVGARLLTASLLLPWLLAVRRSELLSLASHRQRNVLWLIVLTGLFDTGSNALFLIASSLGDLTVVAVLSSLYPASTVVLARFVLDERMSRLQFGGLVAAIVATVLIALG